MAVAGFISAGSPGWFTCGCLHSGVRLPNSEGAFWEHGFIEDGVYREVVNVGFSV